MRDLVCAVPAELADIWWVYDLILIAVIALAAVVLIFFRKRSAFKEATALLRQARKLLCASGGRNSKRRINLFTARNLINSAVYSYQRCVNEQDMFGLVGRIKSLEDLSEKLQAETENNSSDDAEERIKNLCSEFDEAMSGRIR